MFDDVWLNYKVYCVVFYAFYYHFVEVMGFGFGKLDKMKVYHMSFRHDKIRKGAQTDCAPFLKISLLKLCTNN